MARSELTKRLIVAAVGIPLVVLALVVGRWALAPLLGLFCAGAALEFYNFAEQRGIRPLRVGGAVVAAGLVMIAAVWPVLAVAAPILWAVVVGFVLITALAAIWTRGPEGQPVQAVSVTVAGALLPGAAMTHVIFLRHLPLAGMAGAVPVLVGVALVAYPLAVTWITDSSAYFGGKTWGSRKLIPRVSPSKTVEGAVSGLVGGTVAGWLFGYLVLDAWLGVPVGPIAAAVGGTAISAVSQMGDLAESVWKRDAGVKDSGTFFPGHGGILDRMDSLLFTIPAAYAWLTLILGGGPG